MHAVRKHTYTLHICVRRLILELALTRFSLSLSFFLCLNAHFKQTCAHLNNSDHTSTFDAITIHSHMLYVQYILYTYLNTIPVSKETVRLSHGLSFPIFLSLRSPVRRRVEHTWWTEPFTTFIIQMSLCTCECVFPHLFIPSLFSYSTLSFSLFGCVASCDFVSIRSLWKFSLPLDRSLCFDGNY